MRPMRRQPHRPFLFHDSLTFGGVFKPLLRLGLDACVRPSIGKALSNDPLEELRGADFVVHAKARTVGIAEIEFRRVAMKMLIGDMVVDANDAALQDREVIFDCVRVPEMGADVFICGMVDATVHHLQALRDSGIDRAVIGHKHGCLIDLLFDDGLECLAIDIGDMECADASVAFNQGENGFLRSRFARCAVLCLASDVTFVGLDDFISAAHWAGKAVIRHRLTNAVHHEPRGLVADVEHAVDLMGADAFLR